MNLKVSGQNTIEEWVTLRKQLNDSSRVSNKKWAEAYDFFYTRIDTRYLTPIQIIKDHLQGEGEGFSIVALQCVLIEFFQALYVGKNHVSPSTPPREHEYCNSENMFTQFLTKRISDPYPKFDDNAAKMFYHHIRCPLLHEGGTLGYAKIKRQSDDHPKRLFSMINLKSGPITVYRDAIQDALKAYLKSYKLLLPRDNECQVAFIRKFDHICLFENEGNK